MSELSAPYLPIPNSSKSVDLTQPMMDDRQQSFIVLVRSFMAAANAPTDHHAALEWAVRRAQILLDYEQQLTQARLNDLIS